MKENFFHSMCNTLILTVLLVSLPLLVRAQNDEQIAVMISVAQAVKTDIGTWQINVGFNFSFDRVKDRGTLRAESYTLLDWDRRAMLPILEVQSDPPNAALPQGVFLLLDRNVRLNPTDGHYYLFLNPTSVTFEGKRPKNVVQQAVTFNTQADATQSDKENAETATAAEGREDANVYIDGQLTRSSGTDFSGTIDLKFKKPFYGVLGSGGSARVYHLAPFFELQAGNDPTGDPDSLKMGLNLQLPVLRFRGASSSAPFRRLFWDSSPQIEAERDFENANFTWDNRLTLLSKVWKPGNARFYWRPFIGHELGVNLASPVVEAKQQLIARPYAGTTLNLIFLTEQAKLQSVAFEASYLRRWPLKNEVMYEQVCDDEGNCKYSLSEVGTRPRDDAYAKLYFNITDSISFTVGYKYGSVPPSFKLVDHKLTLGLTYKIKFKRE